MYKIFSILLILLIFPNISYAELCNYKAEIDKCNTALLAVWIWKKTSFTPWTSLKNFDDFVCIQDSNDKKISQIILDLKFREIDNEMDIYLNDLNTQKDKYFWQEAKLDYVDVLDNIEEKTNYFITKLNNSCPIILEETNICLKDYWNSTDITEFTSTFLQGSNWPCYKLWNIKVSLFKDVALSILVSNQSQVLIDDKKKYDQKIRTKYDNLLDLMMINIWYLERIWKKWPSKTKNVHE